ncbi:hypothetical protein SKAU_G00293510 [Synaphobranchus kaupii]|uniref:Uncharacterized protein n=1 Tax=Synaphobranchus kaupii TaxID=118154 RepID=A0A9Q1EU98_SYNKA|nr:hypothetical protein SKAU_G00293510 [Synaphobranchus kaupii]
MLSASTARNTLPAVTPTRIVALQHLPAEERAQGGSDEALRRKRLPATVSRGRGRARCQMGKERRQQGPGSLTSAAPAKTLTPQAWNWVPGRRSDPPRSAGLAWAAV